MGKISFQDPSHSDSFCLSSLFLSIGETNCEDQLRLYSVTMRSHDVDVDVDIDVDVDVDVDIDVDADADDVDKK